MDEAHRDVRLWLEKVLEGESIPTYEISAESVNILNYIRLWNVEGDKDMQIQRSICESQTEEYRAEAKRMDLIVDSVLPINEFSISPSESLLKVITDVSDILGFSDPDISSLLIALNRLKIEGATLDIDRLEREALAEKRSEQKVQSLYALDLSEKALKRAETESKKFHQASKSRGTKTEFFKEKQKEYFKSGEKYKQALVKNLSSKELTHANIRKIKKELDDTNPILDALLLKLKGYNELPPSLDLAKVKVEEAKRKLKELTDILTKEISKLAY